MSDRPAELGHPRGERVDVVGREVRRPDRRLALLHDRPDARDALAAAVEELVAAGLLASPAGSRRPAEQLAVEALRALDVGRRQVDPARRAGLVANCVQAYCSIGVGEQAARLERGHRRAERDLDDAGRAADLDRARDRRPVHDLRDATCRAARRRGARPLSVAELRSGPVPTTEIGSDSSIASTPSRSASAERVRALVRGQRLGQERQVLEQREQHRPVDPEPLDDLDLQRDGARRRRRCGRRSRRRPASRACRRSRHRRPGASPGRRGSRPRGRRRCPGARRSCAAAATGRIQRERVRRADQERAEVAGVVGVGDRRRGRRAELAEERPHARDEPDDVVRGERQDRVLDRVVRAARRRAAASRASSSARASSTVSPRRRWSSNATV